MPRVNPSSPVYTGLHPDPHARAHLVFAEGDGAAAVIDLVTRADGEFLSRATLLYTGGASLLPPGTIVLPGVPLLLREAAQYLERATMGTAIYVTGSASFIAETVNLAAGYGVSPTALMTDLRGGAGKRVQCVHCKSFVAEVVTATVTCPVCRINLMVRDHYSHRLGAFMGVSCEAEQAG